MWKYLTLSISLLLTACGGGGSASTSNDTSFATSPAAKNTASIDFSLFTDDNLKRCIERLDVTSIGQITQLSCNAGWQSSISDLSGIEQLSYLQELTLIQHELDNINPLTKLRSLKHLDLSFSTVNDLEVIRQLSQLNYLDLAMVYTSQEENGEINTADEPNLLFPIRPRAPIDNLDFLINLNKLTELNLSGAQIENWQGIDVLRNLEKLTLVSIQGGSYTSIGFKPGDQADVTFDFSVLASLRKLKSLNISGNGLTHVNNISLLFNLTHLSISDNKVLRDFSGIGELNRLRVLEMDNIGFNYPEITWSGDNDFIVETEVKSTYSKEPNLEPIGLLTNLKELYFSQSGAQNYNWLTRLSSLESLDLSGSNFTDLSQLHSLKQLKTLNLSNLNSLSYTTESLSQLAELNTLSSLKIKSNVIIKSSSILDVEQYEIDISFLNHLQNLDELELLELVFTDLTPIIELKKLKKLSIGREVSDLPKYQKNIHLLQQLSDLNDLTSLSLSGYFLDDYAFLSDLIRLEELNISNKIIDSVDFLKDLPNLKILELYGDHRRSYESNNKDKQVLNIDAISSSNIKALSLQWFNIESLLPLKPLLESNKLRQLDLMFSNIPCGEEDITAKYFNNKPFVRIFNTDEWINGDPRPYTQASNYYACLENSTNEIEESNLNTEN